MEDMDALTLARDQCLGLGEGRTPAAPKMNQSQKHVSNGLPIEQGDDVKCVKGYASVYLGRFISAWRRCSQKCPLSRI